MAESRAAFLQQQAATRAAAQSAAQRSAQALQWQLLQQEDQQQQAAVSRASCLRQIRAAGAAAVHRRQQLAGAVARQTNLFSKHLKRGEVAVVRAAGQQAATSHAGRLRQYNTEAALLALQKQEDMGHGVAAKARQERQQPQQALSAAEAIEQTEQAARNARAAAQRLREQQQLSTVGPAGGVWGSASPDAALRLPLRVALVGAVVTATASPADKARVQ
ncbi:hypothetical protein OEZ86_006850 [Tetradesmus obliquus]|nr:hypothetical protein OEZ86_006850 [Tetradesmus obliquus]